MIDQAHDLSWSISNRMEFIEFRLFWEDHVNRADLMETFDISRNQATHDINRYLTLAPENMAYNKRLRTYEPTKSFAPRFLKPEAGGYLSQLQSVAASILPEDVAWIDELPEFDATPLPVRGVDAQVLQHILRACRQNLALEIFYQSLSRPEPMWRWIVPHAIAFDGFRWHARAWCEIDHAYKDFLLSRMREVRGARETQVVGDNDLNWQSRIDIKIEPHPELSASQKEVIAQDYGMEGGVGIISVRKAMAYYALKRLGLDTDPNARNASDQHIVLANPEEVYEALGRALR